MRHKPSEIAATATAPDAAHCLPRADEDAELVRFGAAHITSNGDITREWARDEDLEVVYGQRAEPKWGRNRHDLVTHTLVVCTPGMQSPCTHNCDAGAATGGWYLLHAIFSSDPPPKPALGARPELTFCRRPANSPSCASRRHRSKFSSGTSKHTVVQQPFRSNNPLSKPGSNTAHPEGFWGNAM